MASAVTPIDAFTIITKQRNSTDSRIATGTEIGTETEETANGTEIANETETATRIITTVDTEVRTMPVEVVADLIIIRRRPIATRRHAIVNEPTESVPNGNQNKRFSFLFVLLRV